MEERISDIIAEEENNKAQLFKQFCDETNSVNIAEMWKLKKTIWPKKQERLPTGKVNNKGQMVTNTDEIKELYSNEFRERLRSRPSHPGFLEIHKLKKSIFQLKLEKARASISNDWTMKELEDVLKNIKKGKSREQSAAQSFTGTNEKYGVVL